MWESVLSENEPDSIITVVFCMLAPEGRIRNDRIIPGGTRSIIPGYN